MSDCITYILYQILVRCALARTAQSVGDVIEIKSLLLILCIVFVSYSKPNSSEQLSTASFSTAKLLQNNPRTNIGTFCVLMLSASPNRSPHVYLLETKRECKAFIVMAAPTVCMTTPPPYRSVLLLIPTGNCYTQCAGSQTGRYVFEQFRITWRCPHDFIVFPHRLGGKTKTISELPLSDLVQKYTCCTVLIIHRIRTANL